MLIAALLAEPISERKTPQEKFSYALGMQIGNGFRKLALDVDPATVFVPSYLAYGEDGAGQIIPPNSALIFEIELLSVEEKEGPRRERE